MANKPLLSFSSGELDPILTDNVTLEKFNKGLSTARNVIIGKTGSILSRFSRLHVASAQNSGEAIKIYSPPNTGLLLEWGNLYVRVYEYSSFDLGAPGLSLAGSAVHALTEGDLHNLHFETSKDYVYVFCVGKEMLKFRLSDYTFVPSAEVFEVLDPLDPLSVSAVGAPTGYDVDYLATIVVNGEESLYVENTTGYNKPIAAGQSNIVTTGWVTADLNDGEVSEVRIYSRPSGGGAYGFLGATTKFTVVGANTVADFEDLGSLPDFTNGVQDLLSKYGLNGQEIIDLNPRTGAIYQQRLIVTTENDKEALLASRPKFQNNFYRDFPFAADSALQFKSGTSGKAEVLRIIDNDGLIVFTTNGVYVNTGLLSVNNLALDRKGGWIIKESIPPLVVPGGVFFVDQSNIIRQLIFSQEIQAYESLEQTIFSNHLFKTRTIETWAFQDGITPVIIVTFSDGTFATFTYNFEHQMNAWTRHDSKYPIEQVEGTSTPDVTFYVINKDDDRYIEMSLPRRVPVQVFVNNPEADKLVHTAFMDSISSLSNLLNDQYSFGVSDFFDITPVVIDDWEGDLNFTTNIGVNLSLVFSVGDVWRVFNPEDGSAIDLTIKSFSGAGVFAIVTPSEEFPSELTRSARVYQTYNLVTPLTADHLEGESVSVMVDGALVASPYNDKENYSEVIVTSSAITLPDNMRGAIIHVGRPIVADVKTLNISTLEQSPTLIESLNVNKLYVRVNETRGLYCSNEFPGEITGTVDGTSVAGMEDLDEALMPLTDILIGNRFLPPMSKRIPVTIPGSWDSQGKVSFRQVDPFHFEILSIIPDVEVLKRSDR